MEDGVRGLVPEPSRASSSAGQSACFTCKRPLVRFQPRPFPIEVRLRRRRSHRVAVAQQVERPSETRRAAGSSPAGHITRLRSSTGQSCRLLIGGVQVRILPPELFARRRRRPVSVEARLADIEQGLVRFQGLRPSCPRGRTVMTPGSQPGGSGFDSRRGYRRTTCICL